VKVKCVLEEVDMEIKGYLSVSIGDICRMKRGHLSVFRYMKIPKLGVTLLGMQEKKWSRLPDSETRNFLRHPCAGCPLAKSFGKSQNSGSPCSVCKKKWSRLPDLNRGSADGHWTTVGSSQNPFSNYSPPHWPVYAKTGCRNLKQGIFISI